MDVNEQKDTMHDPNDDQNDDQENDVIQRRNINEPIDLQITAIQEMIAEQDCSELNDQQAINDDESVTEHNLIPVPQDISQELINNNEEWRQAIIAQINASSSHTGRQHRFLSLGRSQMPNPHIQDRQFYAQMDPNNMYNYAQWDPNVTQEKVREFLNQNESSDEEITWGQSSDTDEDTKRREEEKIFDLNSSDVEDQALVTMTMDTSLLIKPNTKYDIFEKDTWIADSDASTHMSNSDDGM